MKAALQAKQKNDMEQAKIFLRTAKGFDPMIEAARSGKTVDISAVSRPEIYSPPRSFYTDYQVNPLMIYLKNSLVLEIRRVQSLFFVTSQM